MQDAKQVSIDGQTFAIQRVLGRGAFGTSYLAEQGGVPVVLKQFEASYAEVFSRRAQQYRDSSFVSTSSMYGYSGVGVADGRPWLTHEYVEATPFKDFVQKFKFDHKKPKVAIDLGEKLCRAVASLHAAGLVHGHLWNTNVFFTDFGDPIIIDPFLGAPISRDLSSIAVPLTELSPFLAPEQKDLNGNVDVRTDIWHIGALLCRLYTGKPDLAINDLVLRELYRAKVPLGLIKVIWHAIQKDPASRFPDAATLETALSEVFEPEHRRTVYVKPLPQATGVRDGWTRPLRNVLLGLVSVGAVIGLAIFINDFFAAGTKPQPVPVSVTPALSSARATHQNRHVLMETSLGQIEIELLEDQVPATAGRFASLASQKFYDGLVFHRVLPDFMIQGGDPTGTGKGGTGQKVQDEILPNLRFSSSGMVAMAGNGPNSGDSQFFITERASLPNLDGKHTIFGRVLNGMETVRKIARVPAHDGKPDSPVRMLRVAIVDGQIGSERAAPGTSAGENTCDPLPSGLPSDDLLQKLVPDGSPGNARISWRAQTQKDNNGYNIYRSDKQIGPWVRVNRELVPGQGDYDRPMDFCFKDIGLQRGQQYWYYVESLSNSGKREIVVSPVRVTAKTVAEERAWLRKKAAEAAGQNESR